MCTYELELGSFTTSETHVEFANTLRGTGYDGLVVYEAKPSQHLERDLKLFTKVYNN